MTLVARLLAQRRQGEQLMEGCAERPNLHIHDDHPPVKLGRGVRTGVGCARVSRQTSHVRWDGGALRLLIKLKEHNVGGVRLNGAIVSDSTETVLRDGDVIRIAPNDPVHLQQRQMVYDYKVELIASSSSDDDDDDEAATPPSSQAATTTATTNAAAAAASTTTAHSAVSNSSSSSSSRPLLFAVADEVQCAMCMEICVECTVLVPCGHFFCGTPCATSIVGSCPTCRTPPQSRMRLPAMDHVITKLIRSSCPTPCPPTVLPPPQQQQQNNNSNHAEDDLQEDVREYLRRTKQTLPTVPAAAAAAAVAVAAVGRVATTAATTPATPNTMTSKAATLTGRRRKRKRVEYPVCLTSKGQTPEDAICID